MKCYITALAAVLFFSAAGDLTRAADFAFGADLSFLKQAEDRGTIFKDGTNAAPGLQIFKNHGYNWRRACEFTNRVGPLPEKPEGQREYLDELTRVALATPNERCEGIFWWEPAVGNRGDLVSRSFFDENGNSLPVISIFDKYTWPTPRTNGQ